MKLFLVFTLLSSFAFAKTVARVSNIEGAAFYYGATGQVQSLGYSDKIAVGSKVMLEDSARVTLKTEDGSVYYLTSGTFAKFYEDGIELKNGKVWVKSVAGSKHSIVQTANSKGIHSKGQYVYSFDNVSGKSEVLNIFGSVEFSNLTQEDLKTKVLAGEFTFVALDENDGLPRSATRVGVKSYESIKVAFSGFSDLKKLNFENISGEMSATKRSIASVSSLKKKGSLKFVKYNYKNKAKRKIASVKQVSKKKVSKVKTKTASIRVFKSKPVVMVAPKVVRRVQTKTIPSLDIAPTRMPASVDNKKVQEINTVSLFEKSLRQNIQNKPKHKSEVNELIDDLKSYKEDFVKEY